MMGKQRRSDWELKIVLLVEFFKEIYFKNKEERKKKLIIIWIFQEAVENKEKINCESYPFKVYPFS